MSLSSSPATRWFILGLSALTVIFAYTVPTTLLPVLFAEIAADLDLTVLQLGVAWGSISLSSVLVGLFGGAIGDRLGSKRMLGYCCLIAGVLGGLRSFAPNYILLIVTFMVYSLVAPAIPPNLHKASAYFFPKQRGIATGGISLAFAFALFLGSRYTATWVSPMVGGWRNTLLLFGAFGLLFGIIWLLIPDGVLPAPANRDKPFLQAIFGSVRVVLGIREVWIIGVGSMLFWACFRGFLGYTPLYLRDLGWDVVKADSTLSYFFLASLFLAMPLTIWSDRVGRRRPFLFVTVLIIGAGTLLLAIGTELWIVLGLVASGLMFDAFMGIHQAAVLDLPDIGAYTGSALGLLVMFREIGGIVGPPIGNALVQFGPSTPYYFWGGIGIAA